MSYPDFSEHGYQVLRELGRNREGGRITWLASKVDTGEQVVIKQFCFAQAGSSWSGFRACEKEIQFLQKLNHPGIPQYLSSFERPDGFCLVQEYINAPSLAETRSFAPEEIKQIAVKALEILVYLQNRIAPIIHRDIKPENILVDEQLNVYIIDFGFARVGSQEVAASSVFRGTPGFIPPEQMFKPTDATDLYALGATLICLLTGIQSTRIDQLQDQDDPYLIKFYHLLPRLSLRFLGWLEKMVQPIQKNRFANAKSALEALKPLDVIRVAGNAQSALEALKSLDVIRVAGVDFSETVLNFKANRLGEKLTPSITIENPISDTLLEGRWEVAPHPQDPPHTPDDHAWISVTPAQFSGNHTRFQVHVDTSKLMADKQYKRQLILHSNAYPANHTLTVKVQTAALPIEKREVPYVWLTGVLLISAIAPISMAWLIAVAGLSLTMTWLIAVAGLSLTMTWLIAVAGLWRVIMAVVEAVIGLGIGLMIGSFGGTLIAYLTDFIAMVFGANHNIYANIEIIGVVIGGVVGFAFGAFAGWKRHNDYREWDWSKVILYLLTAGLGTSFGIFCIVRFVNPYILFALTGTGLPLVSILLYSLPKRRRLITKYRQSEESLIKS
ncbi:serine/threonine protein kinase [Nostoc commune NIES-4072]|uniref:Serine/threonine protein kinase n=1 Tax=Nostoc commune NIES-4072 TaxID=2005467 RepID=A0A2R5FLQ5_NOSCO|nr:serine/threonine-protein kinase [Nostoc commune]BBD64285.1 serine/threonine protein kinase [Nostoc commune HK-02]GBG18388.1 serine/threonine protein kinase [Nostoc commune NIES-4072]